MSELMYVVSQFGDNGYVLSVHCSPQCLDEVVKHAKEQGYGVKITAYFSDENYRKEG